MNRAKMLKYINPIIAVLILNQLQSGIFSKALHYGTFQVLHKGGGLLLFIGVLVHVVLNRGWIKSTYLKR